VNAGLRPYSRTGVSSYQTPLETDLSGLARACQPVPGGLGLSGSCNTLGCKLTSENIGVRIGRPHT